MAEARRSTRREVVRLAERVKRAVDEGADTAEGIHKRVASLPLDLLEQIDLFEETVRDVRKMQDQAIEALYGLVRGINHEVIRFAKGTLGGPAPRRRARPRKKAIKVASEAA